MSDSVRSRFKVSATRSHGCASFLQLRLWVAERQKVTFGLAAFFVALFGYLVR